MSGKNMFIAKQSEMEPNVFVIIIIESFWWQIKAE